MNAQLPDPDYATATEFRWPWWKFRLPPDALFTSLHERFNTRPSAVQDPLAFHRDVVECADNSVTETEFYDRLATRKDERINEINDAWAEISCLLGGTPAIWSCPCFGEHAQDDNTGNDSSASRWRAFMHLCRSMSSDCLVMFFDEYARDERKRQDAEREKARRELDKLCPPRRAKKSESAVDAKPLESTHGSGTHSEPSVSACPTILDAATPHPPLHGVQANLPSPPSTSSTSAKTPPRKRETDMSHRTVSAADGSEDEKELDKERIDTGPSYAGKTRRPPSKPETCVPISPDSSHDETVRANDVGDYRGGTSRQRPGPHESSPVLKRSHSQSDAAPLRTTSLSNAFCDKSVVKPVSSSSSAATSSPPPQSTKRKSQHDEGGAGDFASTRQMRKRRRVG